MQRLCRAKQDIFKRVLAFTLLFALLTVLIPRFTIQTRANEHDEVLESIARFFGFATRPAREFRSAVEGAVKEITGHTEVRIDGSRALYTVRGGQNLQIGEYIFPRYEPGDIIGGSATEASLTRYFSLGGRDARTYYVPFFIFRNDLHFLVPAQTLGGIPRDLTVGSARYEMNSLPSGNSFLRSLRMGAGQVMGVSGNLQEIRISQNFSNFSYNVQWQQAGFAPPPQTRTTADTWVNVSEFLRQGNTTPIQAAHLRSFQAILGSSNPAEVSAFGEQGVFGFFHVPPSFHAASGMTLNDYILTLNANTLFEQPPEESEHEFELPDKIRKILDALGDDDEVEARVCPDTGSVIFNIITNTVGGGKCCCFDDSGIRGYLSQILGEIRSGFDRVIGAVNGVSANITNTFTGGDSNNNFITNITEGVTDGVTQGFNNFFGGDGGNSFITNITEGITQGLNNIFGSSTVFDDSRILAAMLLGFNRVVAALEAISLNINFIENIFDNSYNEAGTPWWRAITDTVIGLPGNIARGIGDGLGSIFSGGGDFFTGMGDVFGGGGAFFSGLGDMFGGAGEFLVGLSSVMRSVLEPLFNGVAGILGSILNGITGIVGAIATILQPILDFVLGFADMLLSFVLSLFDIATSFIVDIITGFQADFASRFPVIDQTETLLNDFNAIVENSSNSAPVFNINFEMFSQNLGGTIDLAFLNPYLSAFHALIIAFAYLLFARKVIKRIPNLLGGIQSIK